MNYSEIFHFMRPELTLIVTIALLFLFDLFAPERLRRYFHPLACVLLTVQILVNIVPTPDSGQLFGGMYQYEPMQSIVKSMLAIGTFVAFLQSNEWLRREDTAHKLGEFYLLTLSLPGRSRAKPKPPVILLRPLNCNVPSLSFKVSISSFSRKLRLVFRGISSITA